jgi:hypothetical protein
VNLHKEAPCDTAAAAYEDAARLADAVAERARRTATFDEHQVWVRVQYVEHLAVGLRAKAAAARDLTALAEEAP